MSFVNKYIPHNNMEKIVIDKSLIKNDYLDIINIQTIENLTRKSIILKNPAIENIFLIKIDMLENIIKIELITIS